MTIIYEKDWIKKGQPKNEWFMVEEVGVIEKDTVSDLVRIIAIRLNGYGKIESRKPKYKKFVGREAEYHRFYSTPCNCLGAILPSGIMIIRTEVRIID